MALRCKVGDLAMVIRTPSGEGVGKIVEVLSFHGKYLWFKDVWLVRLNGEEKCEMGQPYGQPDAWLLPIRPEELKEETEMEVTA